MKEFVITVSGKSLSAILDGIDESKKRIESGSLWGFDSNEDGKLSFDSDGDFEDEDEEPDTPEPETKVFNAMQGGTDGG